MDRLTSMEIFARVAEAKSFSEAARRLKLSKSSVSKHVMALEDRLGARLLNRTTRRLSLTEVGTAYHEWCARIISDVEEAESSVTRLHTEPRGTLRINAPMSFGTLHLAPAIPDFLVRYPGVQVDLTLNDRFVDLVEEGFDVSIRIGQLADSSLIARRLTPIRTVACASPGYLRAHGRPSTPADLAGHNCLVYSYLTAGDVWIFSGPAGEVTVRVSGNFRVNNGDAMRAAALRGLGIVLIPSFIVGGDLRSGALEAVLIDYAGREAAAYAIYPHNRHMSAKLRVFVDFLARRFGRDPYWDQTATGASHSDSATPVGRP